MKTVIITGANSGIGFATARYLAGLPEWHVVLACRDQAKAGAAANAIRQLHPVARVSAVPLDLFSLESVRRLPQWLNMVELSPVHGLILNAGGPMMKEKAPQFTQDGFERSFQLNFLGHFLLANRMVTQLAANARVLFVSSDLHDPAATRMGKIAPPRYGPVEDLAYARGTAAKLSPMQRYGTAKLYAMMTAYELARRLADAGHAMTVNSWAPGVVPTTQAGRHAPAVLKLIIKSRRFVRFMGSHLSTEREAALALGGLLVNPEHAGVSGRYFDGFKEIPSSVESRDEEKAGSVWEQAMTLLNDSIDAETRAPVVSR
jgi:NAD(P)-dependent dehydrogenase (short-subunit alcohol dehydrogenase family)